MERVEARFTGKNVVVSDLDKIGHLVEKGYGKREDDLYHLSAEEALYLLDREEIRVLDEQDNKLSFQEFLTEAKKEIDKFWVRYNIYEDMRDRGYTVKTALKYGSDFRVYERGEKPGEEHAKWLLYAVHESTTLSWRQFSAMNRVAHSVRKNLLIGILDDEGDVTYYEVEWTRP